MTYGGQIWGQKGNANRNKISILQNKILKRIHLNQMMKLLTLYIINQIY